MIDVLKKHADAVSVPFLSALLVGAGYMGFVAWDQSHWWRVKEDYGFGWLVPAFVAFIVYDRWAKITGAAADCAAAGSGRMRGGAATFFKTLCLLSLVGGGLLFLLGAFYRAGAESSSPGTLALTLGTAAVVLPLLYLNAPRSPSPRPVRWRDDARVRLVGFFIFPALVWLVSAPMISVIEQNLSLFLLRRVAAVVFFTFDLLGLSIEQQGNVLLLPTGQVGVEDACSGIRSLTGCLFAGSFLAAVFLDKLWKKVALVACAMGLAFLTNLLRGLFLTAWAYNKGPESIEGIVHDTAGYAVLGLTVVGLLCLLPLFNIKFSFSDDGHDAPPAKE